MASLHVQDGVQAILDQSPLANVTIHRIKSIRLHQRDPEARCIQQLHTIVPCPLKQKRPVAYAIFASHVQVRSVLVPFASTLHSFITDYRKLRGFFSWLLATLLLDEIVLQS
jgi:hypothetical protein